MTPDLLGLLRVLAAGDVAFIVIGGVAANVHGALRTTLDLDVVYARDAGNIARLVAALGRTVLIFAARPKGFPSPLEGLDCLVVSLPMLITLKRAAGRGKDREALAELEALLEERDSPDRS